MHKILRYSTSVVVLTLIAWTGTIQVGAENVPLRYTRRLPPIDKVEIQKLKQVEGRIDSIEAAKMLDGKSATSFAALWRAQRFRSRSADCHYPAYGVKFYAKDKLVLSASLCWECDNIVFMEPSLGVKQGFEGESQKGKELLELMKRSLP